MKKWFIVLLGIILASIIIYLIEEVEDSEINEICFEENCFSVEISDTPENRGMIKTAKHLLDVKEK